MAKKAGKTAKTVVDVILGEAGGRTRAERWREMVQIASVIQNRARKLRVSPEDVIGAASEFNAYGKELPAGIEAYRGMANQALQYVQRTGPINAATFYATPSNVPYLPERLVPVTSTGYHNYYADPQDRPIKTGSGLKDVRVVLPTRAPTPVGRPPSADELDPMTTRALRQALPETAPAPTARPDRLGSADPSGRVRAAWDAARDDAAAAALRGLGAFAPSFAPGSPDAVDPSRYADGPMGLGAYSPEVQSALAQAAAASPDPMALGSPGAPSASPLGMGTAVRNAALEAGLARQFTPDRIAANLAAARASNAAPSTGGTIPDAAAMADAAISSRAWGPSPAEIEAARLSYAGQPTTAPSVQRVSDYTTAKADRLAGRHPCHGRRLRLARSSEAAADRAGSNGRRHDAAGPLRNHPGSPEGERCRILRASRRDAGDIHGRPRKGETRADDRGAPDLRHRYRTNLSRSPAGTDAGMRQTRQHARRRPATSSARGSHNGFGSGPPRWAARTTAAVWRRCRPP